MFYISLMEFFRQIMDSARSPSLWNGSLTVYDEKRAYIVILNCSWSHERDFRILDILKFREQVFWKCSATLNSSTLIQRSRDSGARSKERLKESGAEERVDSNLSIDLRWSTVWLFGSKDRHIDFILSADCAAFELDGFLLSSSLGQIVGKPLSVCVVKN